MDELWAHLLSAQDSETGIPAELIEMKKEEILKREANKKRSASPIKRSMSRELVREKKLPEEALKKAIEIKERHKQRNEAKAREENNKPAEKERRSRSKSKEKRSRSRSRQRDRRSLSRDRRDRRTRRSRSRDRRSQSHHKDRRSPIRKRSPVRRDRRSRSRDRRSPPRRERSTSRNRHRRDSSRSRKSPPKSRRERSASRSRNNHKDNDKRSLSNVQSKLLNLAKAGNGKESSPGWVFHSKIFNRWFYSWIFFLENDQHHEVNLRPRKSWESPHLIARHRTLMMIKTNVKLKRSVNIVRRKVQRLSQKMTQKFAIKTIEMTIERIWEIEDQHHVEEIIQDLQEIIVNEGSRVHQKHWKDGKYILIVFFKFS